MQQSAKYAAMAYSLLVGSCRENGVQGVYCCAFVCCRRRIDANDFSDVLDMEYLLLSDTSSITEKSESRNSENNCNFFFISIDCAYTVWFIVWSTIPSIDFQFSFSRNCAYIWYISK